MPFDRHDLARQAGYEEGDVLTLMAWTPNQAISASTTSTTFVQVNTMHRQFFRWDNHLPSGATGVVKLSARIVPGTDETYTVRIFNQTDTESTGAIVSGSAAANVTSDWVEYTPPTTDSLIEFKFQHKTDPGNNSSIVTPTLFTLGVQL